MIRLARLFAMQDRTRFVACLVLCALIAAALLGAASINAITEGDGPYASPLLQRPPLRRGLMVGLSLLVVPLLALLAQCSQLGSPRRDRRLALLRLAGATSAQARLLGVLGSLVPALAGAALGAGVYLALQRLLDGPLTVLGTYVEEVVRQDGPDSSLVISRERQGLVRLAPTDAPPRAAEVLAIVVAISFLAALSAWAATRRIAYTPLGVVRHRRREGPPNAAGLGLLALGLGGMLSFSAVRQTLGAPDNVTRLDVVVVTLLAGLTVLGLLLGMASLSAAVGAFIGTRAERPAPLIAGRRLESDPFASSRTLALVAAALLIVVSGQAVKAHFLVIVDPADPLYRDALRLVDVAYGLALLLAAVGIGLRAIESRLTTRHQVALHVASGVPESTLRRSLVLETLIPLVPVSLVAGVTGILGTRGILGTFDTQYIQQGRTTEVIRVPIPMPFAEVAVVLVGLLVVSVAVTLLVSRGMVTAAADDDLRMGD